MHAVMSRYLDSAHYAITGIMQNKCHHAHYIIAQEKHSDVTAQLMHTIMSLYEDDAYVLCYSTGTIEVP